MGILKIKLGWEAWDTWDTSKMMCFGVYVYCDKVLPLKTSKTLFFKLISIIILFSLGLGYAPQRISFK